MDTKTIDRAFAAGVGLLGIYIVWNAIDYGYMRGVVPGPGFFPFWIGVALVGLSSVNVIRSFRGLEALAAEFDLAGVLKALGIVATTAAFIMTAPLAGMLLGSGLFVLITAFVIRPRWTAGFAGKIIATAVIFPICCHYLFGVYLGVPLVKGVFGF